MIKVDYEPLFSWLADLGRDLLSEAIVRVGGGAKIPFTDHALQRLREELQRVHREAASLDPGIGLPPIRLTVHHETRAIGADWDLSSWRFSALSAPYQ